jgi:hypothetical protein
MDPKNAQALNFKNKKGKEPMTNVIQKMSHQQQQKARVSRDTAQQTREYDSIPAEFTHAQIVSNYSTFIEV